MGRGGKNRSNSKNPKKKSKANDYQDGDMMDDEIDAFHEQRDVVPLDVNDDVTESDEDNEQSVFEIQEDASDDDDDDDDDVEDDSPHAGLAAKIERQQKYLRAKIGGVEDETHDDAEDEEEKRTVWGRRKSAYHERHNGSSDEEHLAEEGEEVLRLQKEKAKSLSTEDFGTEDVSEDESDGEPTFEDILVKGKSVSKASKDKVAQEETGTAYEEVKKDLNALSREEQMDVVYSSAPELVGLLSELNDALEQLENKVNPILTKVRGGETATKGGMNYMELKQLLLTSYCQAITFYLLLKSEGQPVRDHPVIARLVEIKNLLDKTKKLDENLPSELEDILNEKHGPEMVAKFVREDPASESNSLVKDQRPSVVSAKTREVSYEAAELVEVEPSKDHENIGKRKRMSDQVGLQSVEMLKVRAALEEKLKQKGIFSSITQRRNGSKKNLQPVNGQLETLDDFDDDAMDIERDGHGMSNGHASSLSSSKLSQLVTSKAKKAKVISGDDDLPNRDDIGERRRKHELRVLAGAGVKSDDDDADNDEADNVLEDSDGVADTAVDGDESESDFELYQQAEEQRAAKLAAKADIYSRTPATPSLADPIVDGKRHISYQIEKNRGLTRARKKLIKNPRKKYKLKHQKAVVRRKGQVREVKKASGPYGGETSGINTRISRSVRFKS